MLAVLYMVMYMVGNQVNPAAILDLLLQALLLIQWSRHAKFNWIYWSSMPNSIGSTGLGMPYANSSTVLGVPNSVKTPGLGMEE